MNIFLWFSYAVGVIAMHAVCTWLLYVPVVWAEYYCEKTAAVRRMKSCGTYSLEIVVRGCPRLSEFVPAWFRYGVAPLWGAVDVLFNLTSAVVLFGDLPREWLFTNRMRRYLSTDEYVGPILTPEEIRTLSDGTRYWYDEIGAPNWRFWAAKAVCAALLDSVAPEGRHCRCENADK